MPSRQLAAAELGHPGSQHDGARWVSAALSAGVWHAEEVRISEFWRLMAEEFGPGYATSVARDQCLTSLAGQTADQALAQGVPPRTVWLALCEAMQVPADRVWGRPHRD